MTSGDIVSFITSGFIMSDTFLNCFFSIYLIVIVFNAYHSVNCIHLLEFKVCEKLLRL